MSSDSRRATSLEFGKLPLAEVVARFTLAKPIQLTYDTVGRLGEKLRPDFPQLSEVSGVMVPPGISGGILVGPGILPGALFTGHALGLMVTLHQQMLGVKWERQIGPNPPAYPGWKEVRDTLWSSQDALIEVLSPEGVPVCVANMVYANLIKPRTAETVLRDYFSKAVHSEVAMKGRPLHELTISWRDEAPLDLRFHLQATTVRGEEGFFRLATSAGITVGEAEEPRDLIERLHDRLQAFFLEIISDHAKEEWGYQERPDA